MAKGYKVGNKVRRGDRFTDIVREARKQASKFVSIATHQTVVGQLNLELQAARNRENGLRLDLGTANKEKQTLIENWKGVYADKVKQLWQKELRVSALEHQEAVIKDIVAGKQLDAVKKLVEGPSAREFEIKMNVVYAGGDPPPETKTVVATVVKKE